MTTASPSPPPASVTKALLAFYDESARDLPWRRSRDPYAVWVSEIMAQQTRVETAAPYYEQWIERFPDVAALADADLETVLKAWEGLGYYSRARNLHSAARIVRERHSGTVPGTYAALRELPGVGEYTAGAIASIAFGLHTPAVDGNVRRVLARLLDEPAPPAALLREVATAMLPRDRPGDFNQALMELGATVCTPRAPRCQRCPIADCCAARAAGTQLDRPRPRTKKVVPVFDLATAVLRDPAGRVLITRRPPTGLLAGMWNFPAREVAAGESADIVVEIAESFGRVLSTPLPIGVIEHTFSHRRERYDCYIIDVDHASETDADHAWIGEDRTGYVLPRAQQRIHALAFRALLAGVSGQPQCAMSNAEHAENV